ncbi:hypothetical protein SAMN02746065_11745 [Desulfocicer vacuolatum DSM 3385]|uniref:Uncharacterized protein n=1 Tax=Desulfocicer vacuolatum DSM 3385 TaxID=1121400 RepID=A0A1W2DEZ9_9BACT|nr:hypothetical protein SAMN02746065_11745 [Desulfocicer vacuolatum DSM 3385]
MDLPLPVRTNGSDLGAHGVITSSKIELFRRIL